MARIPLLEEFPAAVAELAGRIRSERRGVLLKLYKALLYSPPLAQTWFEHLNAVRWKTSLSGRIRELVIIRIALIHSVAYVIRQHIPKLAEAEGVTPQECEALKDWMRASYFNAAEKAALAYADSVTTAVQVPNDVFEQLRTHFSEREIVELTVLIATYNMHIRVVEALQIEPESA
jgi:alkylhydroperoxidase family enzyme